MLKLKLGNIIHLHGGAGALNSREESSALGSLYCNYTVGQRDLEVGMCVVLLTSVSFLSGTVTALADVQ